MLHAIADFWGAGPGNLLVYSALSLSVFALARPLSPPQPWMRLALVLPPATVFLMDELMMVLTKGCHGLMGATSEVPFLAAAILVILSWPTARILCTAILPNPTRIGPLLFAVGVGGAIFFAQPATVLALSALIALWIDTVPHPERGWARTQQPTRFILAIGSLIAGLWLSSGWVSLRTVFEPSLAGATAVVIGIAIAKTISLRVQTLLWAGLLGVGLWLMPHGLATYAPHFAASAAQQDWGLVGTTWILLPMFALGAISGPLIHMGTNRSRYELFGLALGLGLGPWIATHQTIGWFSFAILCLGATFASRSWNRIIFVVSAGATYVLMAWIKPADLTASRLAVWTHASQPKTLASWTRAPKGLSKLSHGQAEGGSFVAWSGPEESGLTVEGLTALTQGRRADAEELSGHLAVLSTPVREPVLVLGDWAGNALRAISAYPKGLAQISVPTTHGLRALAASDSVRERLWLQPNHSLYAEHPARLVRRIPAIPAILEINHAPWSDGANWGLSDSHIKTIKSRLISDGVYVLCVHLRWWPDGSLPRLAKGLTDHFDAVQAWLPPEGVDSLIFLASDQPLNPSQVKARFGHAKTALETLGYPTPESFSGAAVLGTDALVELGQEASDRLHPERLPSSVLSRPLLHVAGFPDRMAKHPDPWSGLGNNDITNVRKARGMLLSMLSKANKGELEGAFQAAQSLASQHGQLGTSALESLIEPHIKDGRTALKRAIQAGPSSTAWDDAARFATTARMLAPKSHIPSALLGDIALAKGHADKAIEHYQFALSVDQTYIPALEGIARWARLTGEAKKAEQALRSATRHEPRNWQTWHNLGVFLMEEDRLTDALEAIETALGLAPIDEPAPLIALTTGLLRTDQPGAALLRSDQLTKLEPDLGLAWFLRGRAHFDLDRLSEAEEDFRKAVLTDSNLIEARSGIGLVRAILGDHDAATTIFRDVLKRDPENMAARENLRRLGAAEGGTP